MRTGLIKPWLIASAALSRISIIRGPIKCPSDTGGGVDGGSLKNLRAKS